MWAVQLTIISIWTSCALPGKVRNLPKLLWLWCITKSWSWRQYNSCPSLTVLRGKQWWHSTISIALIRYGVGYSNCNLQRGGFLLINADTHGATVESDTLLALVCEKTTLSFVCLYSVTNWIEIFFSILCSGWGSARWRKIRFLSTLPISDWTKLMDINIGTNVFDH